MKIRPGYIPLIIPSILALLFAMWAGLIRIGWDLPTIKDLPNAHGPLMISGFLGSLIALERAVAIRQKWMYGVPVISAIGLIVLFLYPTAGVVLILIASIGTLAILCVMVYREPRLHTVVMATGALSWLIGNALWFSGRSIFQIVIWWISFLVLTIGGERLELNRVFRPSSNKSFLFSALAVALFTGAITSIFDLNLGSRISGLAMLGLSLWFLKNDLANRNIHSTNPLTRYIALCLYGGFIWLGISGGIFTYFGAVYAGPIYDAALHSVFVGYIIAMIFGHAPIIFPAIIGVQIKFYQIYYFHLILLHLSLILRIIGDLGGQIDIRMWGGLLNVVAITIFLVITIYSIIQGRKI